jgi:hypothetical protein
MRSFADWARARQQEIGRENFAILLACHHIPVLGRALAIVDLRKGSRRIAECRVDGHVLDQLAADIDSSSVADAVEIVPAGHQHAAMRPS